MREKHSTPFSYLILFVLVVLCLFLWEQASLYERIDPLFFSRPSLIWAKTLETLQNGMLWKHLSVTLEEAAWGLLFGGMLGSVVGLCLGIWERYLPLVLPVFSAINSIPKLALAPLFIVWFGIGLLSKIMMTALMVFFLFVFNLYAGYHNLDREMLLALRLLGASPWQVFCYGMLPASLPWFLASLRTGMGLALTGAVVGELIGASKGLGWLLNDAGARYDVTLVFTCIFVVVLLMMCLDRLLCVLERLLLRWKPNL